MAAAMAWHMDADLAETYSMDVAGFTAARAGPIARAYAESSGPSPLPVVLAAFPPVSPGKKPGGAGRWHDMQYLKDVDGTTAFRGFVAAARALMPFTYELATGRVQYFIIRRQHLTRHARYFGV